MSTEPDLNAEFILPDELRSVEAGLQQFAPGSSQLNRDELMFRAGWEAACAQSNAQIFTSTPRLRVWQAAAGVLAASLILVLTQLESKESVGTMAEVRPKVDEHTMPEISTPQPARPPAKYLQPTTIRSTAPLLVLRGRALSQDFSELPVNSFTGNVSSPTATTNRTLLHELLSREQFSAEPMHRSPRRTLGEPS